MSDYLMQTYARQPVAFVRGEGAWLFDEAGEKYLDALAGVAVNGLGHAHPRLAKALCEQAGRLIHTSNIYRIPEQESLAARLCGLSGMDRVFFCNSGAEANEAAIKIARLHGHNQGIENPAIVVMEQSFHGRTMATLSATGSRKVQAGFEPLVTGFVRVPFGDSEAVQKLAEHHKNIVAVLVEPYQGEGGVNIPEKQYLAQLRAICDHNGWLLMLDEVQTGIGRTGKWFAFQHTDILPDVMTLAKGLGSGVPVGACLARGVAATTFVPGKHGSTFGGGPLACTAALTTLSVMEEEGLPAHAAALGEFIRSDLANRLQGLPGVRDIRGQGLMIGIELDRPCGELVKQALAEKLLINVTHDTVVRLLPPLIMKQEDAGLLTEKLATLIRAYLD
ncbi:MAG TPA: aspartate aminotransferase family protein [Thiobacillaceae bacterium]|nr:aspartate aminotransferase family protein [Thiobacillaceae bacterium]HNA83242.1 aspartate aminotransferase family protein [Thiobacillaceae bacterium]HNF89487.1 aspartate aminotransferase family protein [Thiobacillaceae bacterium]HNH89805.1 aspartate aminotransferase family protein [Thiobacillaceae bacterium]HNI08345.1 aspartate aminotransferase family protein [Thiobacillaceae bacterium]